MILPTMKCARQCEKYVRRAKEALWLSACYTTFSPKVIRGTSCAQMFRKWLTHTSTTAAGLIESACIWFATKC